MAEETPKKPPIEQLIDMIRAVADFQPEGLIPIEDAIDLYLLGQLDEERRSAIRRITGDLISGFKVPSAKVDSNSVPIVQRKRKCAVVIPEEKQTAKVIPFRSRGHHG